jgi:hypothetical protein
MKFSPERKSGRESLIRSARKVPARNVPRAAVEFQGSWIKDPKLQKDILLFVVSKSHHDVVKLVESDKSTAMTGLVRINRGGKFGNFRSGLILS